MRDEAKSKNKALHRRLSDILDPDIAQTSKLLEKVKPLSWSFSQSPSSEVIQYPDRIPSDSSDTVNDESTVSLQNTVVQEGTVSLENTVPLEDTVFDENTLVLQDRACQEQREDAPPLPHLEKSEDTIVSVDTVSQQKTVLTEDTVFKLDTVSSQNTVIKQTRVSFNNPSSMDQERSDQDQIDLTEIEPKTLYSNRIPYSQDTVFSQGTVSNLNTVSQMNTVPHKQGYLEVPNTVADEIAKRLSPFEWAIYFRLFRLSHGWHKDTCIVGVQSLTEATNTSESQVRRSLKILQEKGLIKVLEVINRRDLKGTRYQVFTVSYQNTVSQKETVFQQNPVVPGNTVFPVEPIKEDHDDLLKKDYHQSAHEREVMMIYGQLTNNSWTKADIAAYKKIKNIPIQIIEQGIRITLQRTSNRPNSLAYFCKEIQNLANPSQQSKTQQKKALEKIVQQVREAHIGQPTYSIAEFAADVKDACIRTGVVFDNDIFNGLIKKS